MWTLKFVLTCIVYEIPHKSAGSVLVLVVVWDG